MSEINHVYSMELDRKYLRMESGKGIYMYTDEGEEIIDGASGPVCASLGHGIKEIGDAIGEQATKLAFAHRDDCATTVLIESCRQIYEFSNHVLYKTFQVNSGSEATETAIKLMTKYNTARGKSGKYKIISRWQSYHGITIGALSLSGFGSRKKGYEHYCFEQGHIAPCYCYRCWFGDKPETCNLQCAKALENEVLAQGPDSVGAFIAEPISGMSLCAVEPHDEYFKEIRRICDKYDMLLILDETMTGYGRTGLPFAYEHFGVTPDLIITGKSMSGGYFPLAAVSMTKEFFDVMNEHNVFFPPGHTWSGSPLGAASFIAAQKYTKDHDLIKQCADRGKYLRKKIEALADSSNIIGNVRGRGLMIGAELVRDKKTKESFEPSLKVASMLQEEALDNHKMLVEASQGCNKGERGDAIVVSPAFVVTEAQIDEIVDRLGQTLATIEKKLKA